MIIIASIQIRKNNPFAALTVIVLIVILFIGMFVIMKPFSVIYSKFMNDTDFIARYNTSNACDGQGYWYNAECHQLPERGRDVMAQARYTWLWVPFIVVVGLFIWYLIVVSKKDPQYFERL